MRRKSLRIDDAEGRTFVYDAENKQVEVIESSTTIGEYFYDGDGKRVKKIAGSEETIFVYDTGGKLIGEYSSIVQTGSNAKTVYTTNDHLGSLRINTDATGQVISRHDYHPFAEETRPHRLRLQGESAKARIQLWYDGKQWERRRAEDNGSGGCPSFHSGICVRLAESAGECY